VKLPPDKERRSYDPKERIIIKRFGKIATTRRVPHFLRNPSKKRKKLIERIKERF